MKKNTQAILLSSFVPPGHPQEKGMRRYQFYYDLFSDMTEGGLRSSIFQLVEKRYLSRYSLNGQSIFRITDAGIGKLSLLYPSLRIKDRKKGDIAGHLLILLQPTIDDPHFLKLRRELNAQLFRQVTRGVYYYSFPVFPPSLMQMIVNSYSTAVSVAQVKEFSLAFPDEANFGFQQKKNLKDSLSGVSKTFVALIDQKVAKNKMNYQSKLAVAQFFSLFVELLQPHASVFFDDKVSRDFFFQVCSQWCEVIEL